MNGPPGSGKDWVGSFLKAQYGCLVTKFAKRLKEMTHGLYGLTDPVGNALEHGAFEPIKDQPNEKLFGATPRQCYIALSENYLKPLYGADVMGRILLQSLLKVDDWRTAVVTDSGFSDEADVLVRHFGVDSIALIRLHRVDYCFSNDSRGYIQLPGVRHFDVDNNGDLSDLAVKIAKIANAIGVVDERAGDSTQQAAQADCSEP